MHWYFAFNIKMGGFVLFYWKKKRFKTHHKSIKWKDFSLCLWVPEYYFPMTHKNIKWTKEIG